MFGGCHYPNSQQQKSGILLDFASPILTDSVKAVDVKAGRAPLAYVNLLQAVVRVVGQCDLHRHHAGLVQAGLPGEMVLGRQTFARHVVKQLVGFHGAERRGGNLVGREQKDGVGGGV